MQRFTRAMAAFGVAVLVAGASWAAGGTCSDATPVALGAISDSLQGDVAWFAVDTSRGGSLIVNTRLAGTNFDARVSVHAACGGPALASGPIGVSVAVTPGTYRVQIERIGGAGSNLEAMLAETDVVAGGGCPGNGDCFLANGDPGCDDTCSGSPCPNCCADVCGIDPFCCSVSWDSICAGEAATVCTVIPVQLQSFEVDG